MNKILTILAAFSLAIGFAGVGSSGGVGSVRADIPIDEVEPNDDCNSVQELGSLVSGDSLIVSGSSDPVEDIYDYFGIAVGTGIFTITLDCTDDLDLWIGFCEEGIFYYVIASATYECPESISGYFLEASDWQILVTGDYATAASDYTLTIAFDECADADGDGFLDEACGGTDCDDTDGTVYPEAEEICDDGIDNDCDGFTDLEDFDCGSGCLPPDEVAPCGEEIVGTTIGASGRIDLWNCVPWVLNGPEYVYELEIGQSSNVTISLSGTDPAEDLALLLVGDSASGACPDNCLAYSDDYGSEEEIVTSLEAGTYFIVIDGYYDSEDDFTLSVDCVAKFTLEMEAAYIEGYLGMDFTLGSLEEFTWATYLILLAPEVRIFPLWAAPLPAIDPPVDYFIAFPFHSLGWIGLYSSLSTEAGVQASALAWVDTALPE